MKKIYICLLTLAITSCSKQLDNQKLMGQDVKFGSPVIIDKIATNPNLDSLYCPFNKSN